MNRRPTFAVLIGRRSIDVDDDVSVSQWANAKRDNNCNNFASNTHTQN